MDGERLGRAVELAARLHGDQKRKGTEIPYIAHPLAVAALVLEQGGGEDDAVAAVLHDVVEDAGGEETLALVEREFGARVGRIVRALSDRIGPDSRSWRQRKEDYIGHLRTAGDDVLRVSLADKLHNARAILADYKEHGDELWQRFRTGSADDQLWYYRSLRDLFLNRRPGPLARELDQVVRELEQLVGSAAPAAGIRIEGPSGALIESIDDWHKHAHPKLADKQWKDGRSAKELAKAWLPPSVPGELTVLLASHESTAGLEFTLVLPEHRTPIDDFEGEPPNLDLFALGTAGGVSIGVGVEAKADEEFGRTLRGRLVGAPPGSNVPARLNGLARALFGRAVIRDDGSLDPDLALLRYQLLTGVGATLAESARRGARRAVFVVHEFRSDGLDPKSLARNQDDYELFVKELFGVAEVPRRGLIGSHRLPGRESIPAHVELFIGKVRTYVGSTRTVGVEAASRG